MPLDTVDLLGIFDEQQAASLMTVPPSAQLLVLKRQVARGGIQPIENSTAPGTNQFTAEELRRFRIEGSASRALREKFGMPPETILPVGYVAGDSWLRSDFAILTGFRAAIIELLAPLTPSSWADMVAAQRFGNLRWGTAASTPGNVTLRPSESPDLRQIVEGAELRAIIQRPILPMDLFPGSGAELFRNIGELYLSCRLRVLALNALDQLATRDRAAATAAGVAGKPSQFFTRDILSIYSNPSDYRQIVDLSMRGLSEAFGMMTTVSFMPPLDPASNNTPRQFRIGVSDAEIMTIAGTDTNRLAAMAF